MTAKPAPESMGIKLRLGHDPDIGNWGHKAQTTLEEALAAACNARVAKEYAKVLHAKGIALKQQSYKDEAAKLRKVAREATKTCQTRIILLKVMFPGYKWTKAVWSYAQLVTKEATRSLQAIDGI